MEKSRRSNKTTTVKSQTTSSSNKSSVATPSSSSTLTSTKFTIQQKVPTGIPPKRGPYSVKRTVVPNDFVLKRRIGEGAKPLFPEKEKGPISPSTSTSSSLSTSPEVQARSTKEPQTAHTPNKRKTPEKVPYFLDERREIDRIKRVYGSRRSRSLSPYRRNIIRATRNRSRTRSPPSSSRRRYRSTHGESRDRHRSSCHHRSDSRSRSRSRERRRDRSDSVTDGRSITPQIIAVPVPMVPPGWGPTMIPPQRFPFMMRPRLPPPNQFVPPPNRFVPRHFGPPPRFFRANGFQRGTFRPRF